MIGQALPRRGTDAFVHAKRHSAQLAGDQLGVRVPLIIHAAGHMMATKPIGLWAEKCREFCRESLHFVGTFNVGSPYIEVPTFPQSLHFVGKCLHFVGSAYESPYESTYIP